jgi:hypothetical protein
MAHEPIRVWWAPWRRRCSCGARRYPCPDTPVPPPARPPEDNRPRWTRPSRPRPGTDHRRWTAGPNEPDDGEPYDNRGRW